MFHQPGPRSWEIIGRIICHLLHGVCLATRHGKAARQGWAPPPTVLLPAGKRGKRVASASLPRCSEYMPHGFCLRIWKGK